MRTPTEVVGCGLWYGRLEGCYSTRIVAHAVCAKQAWAMPRRKLNDRMRFARAKFERVGAHVSTTLNGHLELAVWNWFSVLQF